GPPRPWDAHTTSPLPAAPPALTTLTGERVATLGVATPPALQGYGPALSHALVSALAQATPPLPAQPIPDTLNALNQQGLAAEYADLLSGFARSGVLERKRLQSLGSALRVRYVLLPGLAGLCGGLGGNVGDSGVEDGPGWWNNPRVWVSPLGSPNGPPA